MCIRPPVLGVRVGDDDACPGSGGVASSASSRSWSSVASSSRLAPPSSTNVRRYPACTVQVVAEASSSEPLNGDGLPVNMLNDRILVDPDREEGERRSSGGIVIPATAQVGKRLAWARVVAAGLNVRNMQAG